jgi:hypothetical protein
MEGGEQADVQIMDFAKAFDKCNHSLLVRKVHAYGVRSHVNKWISSFLEERRQSAVVNGFSSAFISVRSPQGSVLVPLLFLVYINDLSDNLEKCTRLFADNTAVYSRVKNATDQLQLQNDIERLADREARWEMKFHPGKCTTLRCTHSPHPLQHDYTLHGHTLELVTSAKYLRNWTGMTKSTVSVTRPTTR